MGTLKVGAARRSPSWRSSLFFLRQRRAKNPLYDLEIASRPPFWVAACAGIIVFGSLMGAMFIGQQFLQNVLGYSTLQAGVSILPAALCMVLVAPRSAKIVEARGARFTLLFGYVFVLLGFLTMLLLWKEDIPYWKVGLGYALVGIGVGLAGTPASHSLTGSVPVRRVGHGLGHRRPPARPRRRDHAVDLRRAADRRLRRGRLGRDRAVGQARLGQRARPSSRSRSTAPRPSRSSTRSTRARSRPRPRRRSCTATSGPTLAGIVAVLLGAVIVFLCFPGREQERSCSPSTPRRTAPAPATRTCRAASPAPAPA